MDLKTTEPTLPSLKRSLQPLSPAFYLRDTITVAKSLLGKGLYVVQNRKKLLGEIVEVEAYLSENDPASHSHPGKTGRSWPMFERGGTCYVYLSYGVNHCVNVVTRKENCGEAILIRALKPLLGLETMQKNRSSRSRGQFLLQNPAELLNGPGKLTQALGIDLRYNGLQFNRSGFKLVDLKKQVPERQIGCSPRIGISKATSRQLRFFIRSSPWLSRRG